ncbi:MAG: DUF2271 domain-containing protein [Spirochaetales bacterium]|jgi:hypothetical protein|nr:DUF2271 domain-containing protein [Spirochaetales bacterium]
MKKILSGFVFTCVVGLAGTAAQPRGTVEVSFTYTRQGGFASNQFAIWIEDARGNHVKTLYATAFTAAGGWKIREQSLPLWVQKANIGGLGKNEIDVFTSATPGSGTLRYRWDGKDSAGQAVPAGEYRVYVEATLRSENRVLYSAPVQLGGQSGEAQVQSRYFGSGSAERGMIGNLRVRVES